MIFLNYQHKQGEREREKERERENSDQRYQDQNVADETMSRFFGVIGSTNYKGTLRSNYLAIVKVASENLSIGEYCRSLIS